MTRRPALLHYLRRPAPALRVRAPLPHLPPSCPGLWASSCLGFTPDPIQAELLRSTAHRLLLNCTRQWGKTTICAAKALHFALTHGESRTVVAAPTLRQSTLFLHKIQGFLTRLAVKWRPVTGLERSVALPNGAQMVSLPGRADSVRGFSADLLILDEAARQPRALIEALTPTLAATNGPLWMLSTPNGHGNLFYEFWHDETGPWTRFRVPATECPRLSPDFLAAERLLLGEHAFRQEYLCEFTQEPGAYFPADLIEAAIDHDIQPLFGGKPLW